MIQIEEHTYSLKNKVLCETTIKILGMTIYKKVETNTNKALLEQYIPLKDHTIIKGFK